LQEWILTALVLAGLWVLILFLPRTSHSSVVVDVVVSPGMSMRQVAFLLAREELIRSEWAVLAYAKARGIDDNIQAGTYTLSPSMSVPSMVGRMVSGEARSTDLVITIPEGLNSWEIDRRLRAGGMTWLAGAFAKESLAHEGRLFPNTYRFRPEATVGEVVQIMRDEGDRRTAPYTSSDILVASLLEKEAKTLTDMKLVAGIIEKRLSLGMLLQLDAAVAYGWCRRITPPGKLCDVTQAPLVSEISSDGPYNLYMRPGLPVGPIGNPGPTALDAAAHPTASDYLYYLSTRDGSKIIFSKTLSEHNANRRKHLGL
jgi:UPF0755 protein